MKNDEKMNEITSSSDKILLNENLDNESYMEEMEFTINRKAIRVKHVIKCDNFSIKRHMVMSRFMIKGITIGAIISAIITLIQWIQKY